MRAVVVALAAASILSAAAAVVLTALIRKPAFEAALATIDAALAKPSASGRAADEAFSSAYRRASGAGEWLSVLKRARRADASGPEGRYLDAALRARRKLPKSEPVAAVAAHALLRGGRPEEALALFGTGASGRGAKDRGASGAALSPERRPGLWAEAFLRSGIASGATIADYGRLASIMDDGAPFLGAAALSLARDDLAAARYWLGKALEEGAIAPASLMWDCGLYDELASRGGADLSSEELALLADAAWKTGDGDLAISRWERSIALDPRRSWKPYASLAMASDGDASASFWQRLRSAFLSGPRGAKRDGALAAYAKELARRGRDSEALSLLGDAEASGEGEGALLVLAVAIRGKSEPEERVAADYARLSEERPDDVEALSARLRLLAERGMAAELAQAYEAAVRRGLRVPDGWYYEAWILAARGMAAEAATIVSREGSDETGPAASFALGSLQSSLGRYSEAAASYGKAASLARTGRERAESLKARGIALMAGGDRDGAAAAFKAAVVADPDDAEAAVLARGAR